jgi:starvation-inducible outer membrane lipoprotein
MTRTGSSLFRLRKLPFAACALALIAGLAACSSGPPLFLSDGRPTVQVQCSAAGDRDSCAQQARARCGGAGYDTVDHSSDGTNYTLVFACQAAK